MWQKRENTLVKKTAIGVLIFIFIVIIIDFRLNRNKQIDESNKTVVAFHENSNKTSPAIIEKTFTATFERNGATSIGANTLSCTTTGNSCTVVAPGITRSGYKIIGWSTKKKGTIIVNVGNEITLTSDRTLYAITKGAQDQPLSVSQKKFTATFHLNGAQGMGTKTLECTTTGSSCTVTAPFIVRSGYSIIGWSISSNGGSTIRVGSPITLTRDANYYAITQAQPQVVNTSTGIQKKFTATFHLNGAQGMGTKTLECTTTGSSCTVTAPFIVRSGYSIIGWSISSNGGSTIRVGNPIKLTRDANYYAITERQQTQTTKTFTATFLKNSAASIGASSRSCTTTGSSCTITAPSITRSGFEIIGWSLSSSGGSNIKVGGTITLTANTTYHAITRQQTKVTTPTGGAYYIDGRSMLTRLNNTRSSVGVGKLTYSTELERLAKIRAEEICRSYSHTRPNGQAFHTITNLPIGENLASGNTNGYIDGSGAFTAWMNSPAHKQNMLHSSYKTVGVAGYYCPTDTYKYKWVQIFSY